MAIYSTICCECILFNFLSMCLYRTGGGVQLRLGSSFTSTALWPSSLCTLTSAPSGRRVRHLNQILSVTGLMFFVQTHSNSLISHPLSCVAPGGFKLRVSCVPSSTPLLPLHSDILASLFTPEGQPYLLEVTHEPTTHRI